MINYKKWMQKRSGTSFRGYILSDYDQLCSTFGQPASKGDGYKIDVEWIVDTPYGVATVYNYKDGHAYLGKRGLDVGQICEWHVGGKSDEAYQWVKLELQERAIDGMR